MKTFKLQAVNGDLFLFDHLKTNSSIRMICIITDLQYLHYNILKEVSPIGPAMHLAWAGPFSTPFAYIHVCNLSDIPKEINIDGLYEMLVSEDENTVKYALDICKSFKTEPQTK